MGPRPINVEREKTNSIDAEVSPESVEIRSEHVMQWYENKMNKHGISMDIEFFMQYNSWTIEV